MEDALWHCCAFHGMLPMWHRVMEILIHDAGLSVLLQNSNGVAITGMHMS